MVSRFLSLAGWPALVVVVVAIVIAQFLTPMRLVHRALWAVAAAVAVIGFVNECRR